MDRLPSAQFRTTYHKLTEPTAVTVNGHVIGIWEPHKARVQSVPDAPPLPRLATPQQKRDAILRRINKVG